MIAQDIIIEKTAQYVLFNEIDDRAHQAVIAVGRVYLVEKDTFMFHQGELATTFYVLLEGAIKLIQVTPEGHQVTVPFLHLRILLSEDQPKPFLLVV